MKSLYAILALIPLTSYATVKESPPPKAEPTTTATAASNANSHSNSVASGGQGGQGGSSYSDGGDSAANNSLTVNGTRNAPAVIGAAVYPTAGCQGGIGLGGSGVNGGGLVNFSFTKRECETVVLAQNFAALGMPDAACEILKTTKAFKRSKVVVDCTPKPVVIPVCPVPPVAPVASCVTREYLEQRDRKMITTIGGK